MNGGVIIDEAGKSLGRWKDPDFTPRLGDVLILGGVEYEVTKVHINTSSQKDPHHETMVPLFKDNPDELGPGLIYQSHTLRIHVRISKVST